LQQFLQTAPNTAEKVTAIYLLLNRLNQYTVIDHNAINIGSAHINADKQILPLSIRTMFRLHTVIRYI
jgi:hypothetical protein